jgi:hypothetical protein
LRGMTPSSSLVLSPSAQTARTHIMWTYKIYKERNHKVSKGGLTHRNTGKFPCAPPFMYSFGAPTL